jgi:hypothetical protein
MADGDQLVETDRATPTGQSIIVPFEGGGTGVEVLSWGQRELWQVMEEKQKWLPIGQVLPLTEGTTVEDAVADLRFVMSRYPSMRTRLRFDPDGPKQVVSAAGQARLEVVDAAPEADPAKVADEVWWRYWRQDYDFLTEWPLRMAVVRHRGALTHRVWVMCHLVTDGAGARVILQELAARDSSGSEAAQSALEQARWQGSPVGQRQCAAALRYWEKIMRRVTARRFPERTEKPYPRYWQAKLDSPALSLAVRAISARTGVEGTSVLLAVFAVSLARVTGINPVVFQPNVNNRFRPRLARSVSPIIHLGLCVVEVPDGTVDEVVVLTRARAMAAYKHAYYDPSRLAELLARVNRERGEEVEPGCAFNDRRLKPRDESGPPPTPEQVRDAVSRGSFEWKHKQDEFEFYQLAISINDIPDTVNATVTCDIHYVSPEHVEACVRGMEEVAVAAALDPATRTRVSADVAG